MSLGGRRARVGAGLLALALGLAFQGSRGLWEPDEGRNVNVALHMLASGDWLVPRLNGLPYLDKPPLHFWTIAAGIGWLGGEWGARVPQALAFAAAALLAGALAGRMWDGAAGTLATAVYATMLAPFAAANALTPDTPLAACAAALAYCYWRAELDPGRLAPWAWWLLGGVAAGLGLLAKGPALLVLAAPLALHLVLRGRLTAALRTPGPWLAASAALLLGAAWYVPMLRSLPGAPAYLLDNQVLGRLVGGRYRRNPGALGALAVYPPMLLLGALPWSPCWLAWGRRWRRRVWPEPSPATSLLLLWFAVPLLVFAAASSRLPLYVLPLFTPLAIATGRALALRHAEAPAARSRVAAVAFALWCCALLGLKAGVAAHTVERDSRRQAAWIAAQRVAQPYSLVVVDAHLNGLPFYGYPGLRWVTSRPRPYPLFSPLPTLDEEAPALAAGRLPSLVVVPPDKLGGARRVLAGAGLDCRPRAAGRRLALLLCAPTGRSAARAAR